MEKTEQIVFSINFFSDCPSYSFLNLKGVNAKEGKGQYVNFTGE